jgi:hypothetical protein
VTTAPPRPRNRTQPPAPRPGRVRRWFGGVPWGTGLCAGLSVLLASAPIGAVVRGASWLGPVSAAVAVVVVVGLLLHRAGIAVVTIAQVAGLICLLTAVFSEGLFGVLPGPTAFGRFGELLRGSADQIRATAAPVPASPEITFLLAGALGMVAIAVYLAAVGAESPAAAGVPLLATFAVPVVLTTDLLPWWAMVSSAAGFGLLLVARRGARRQVAGGVALVALASVVALLAGGIFGFVGTEGRLLRSGTGTTGVGLEPFAALRGQLTQSEPTELFQVRGLPRPAYLRSLTLRDYAPQFGFRATRPEPGTALPGTILPDAAGRISDIQIQNVQFSDYWLPLYGVAASVSGLPDSRWTYDVRNDTAYTGQPRQEEGWQERALLAEPTLEQLRTAQGPGPGNEFLATNKVDQRVVDITKQVVQGASNDFDKAFKLQEFFTGPGSPFRYNLSTLPPRGGDPLVEFLTVGRQGFCEQYASAMTVMLRVAGVPARVAIGYTAGVDKGGYRSITTSDAHAWVEAWFPGYGWTTFDPTPLTDGRAITPPYVAAAIAEQQGGAAAPDDQNDPKAAQQTTQPTPEQQPDLPQQPDAQAPADDGPSLLWWLVPVLAVLLVGGLLAIPALLRRSASRRRLTAAAAGGDGAAHSAWAELLADSADRGVSMSPSDTVRAGARRMVREHHLDTTAQQALRTVVSAVEASWYGGGHPAPGELAEPVRQVRAAIAANGALGLRDRLLPRSVLRRSAATSPAPENDDRAVSRR